MVPLLHRFLEILIEQRSTPGIASDTGDVDEKIDVAIVAMSSEGRNMYSREIGNVQSIPSSTSRH